MKTIVIEEKALQGIYDKLEELESKLANSLNKPLDWIDNETFCRLLNISKRTAQNYRDTGVVAYSQPGSKVYYKMADVHAMLQNHYKSVKF